MNVSRLEFERDSGITAIGPHSRSAPARITTQEPV
jgi:hypothetical protein